LMGKLDLKKYSYLQIYVWRNLDDLNIGESFKNIQLADYS